MYLCIYYAIIFLPLFSYSAFFSSSPTPFIVFLLTYSCAAVIVVTPPTQEMLFISYLFVLFSDLLDAFFQPFSIRVICTLIITVYPNSLCISSLRPFLLLSPNSISLPSSFTHSLTPFLPPSQVPPPHLSTSYCSLPPSLIYSCNPHRFEN